MSKFKIGDRVIATEDYQINGIKGSPGTVIGSARDGDMPLVEFDKEMGGHTGGGASKNGVVGKDNHCWYLSEDRLKLIESAPQPFTLIVRPDKSNPDKTIATLKVGKDTVRTETVKRYCKDVYDRDAAIKAVVDKMCGKPVSGVKEVKPVKEVKRHAENGEYIKIVQAYCNTIYVNGSILRVEHQSPYSGNCIWSKNSSGKEICVADREYLVLENYRPDTDCSTSAVGETVCEEPVKVEVPKPIMIGSKELRIGSKFILKPYDEVSNRVYIDEENWGRAYPQVHTAVKIDPETSYIDTGRYNFKPFAIDRIIED